MAFAHFSQQEVDFQVIEVGLGGRLDSTNIVSPQVCAITSISLDHVQTLGTTVPRIAREKAGIIKDGVPVVVAPQTGEAMAVFDEVARRKSAPLVDVAGALSWRKTRADMAGQAFEVAGLRTATACGRPCWETTSWRTPARPSPPWRPWRTAGMPCPERA